MSEDAELQQPRQESARLGERRVLLILLANILWSGYRMVTALSPDTAIAFLVSLALVAIAFVSRTQTITVQNRVIRLEERLRYRELLPRDVAARASALPIGQIIALRFASDAELAGVGERCAGRSARDWQGHQAEGEGLAG